MARRKKYFLKDYDQDFKRFRSLYKRFWMMILIVALILYPFLFGTYFVSIINTVGIAVIAAIGLNLLTGFTGQISLGHAAFMAVGAYSSAYLNIRFGFSFWGGLAAGGVIAGFFGLLVGIPSLRFKGLYLAIATLAFSVILNHAILQWKTVTGGANGLNLPPTSFFGWPINNDIRWYFLIMAFVFMAVGFGSNIARTRIGRAFAAIRDRDVAAEAIGIPLAEYKLQAFIISSVYAGVSGALLAHYTGYISLDNFTLLHSVEFLTMIIVGGLGSVLGSIFGAVLMVLLPEVLNLLAGALSHQYPVFMTRFIDVKLFVYGLIIVLFLMFEPDGLYGRWRKVKNYFIQWPFSY